MSLDPGHVGRRPVGVSGGADARIPENVQARVDPPFVYLVVGVYECEDRPEGSMGSSIAAGADPDAGATDDESAYPGGQSRRVVSRAIVYDDDLGRRGVRKLSKPTLEVTSCAMPRTELGSSDVAPPIRTAAVEGWDWSANS